jgi:hypothetical protein
MTGNLPGVYGQPDADQPLAALRPTSDGVPLSSRTGPRRSPPDEMSSSLPQPRVALMLGKRLRELSPMAFRELQAAKQPIVYL